jgi:hypothetical protein
MKSEAIIMEWIIEIVQMSNLEKVDPGEFLDKETGKFNYKRYAEAVAYHQLDIAHKRRQIFFQFELEQAVEDAKQKVG